MRPDEIAAAVASPDEETRRQAVIAIGEARDASLDEPLLTALSDESWRVREEAVRVGSELAAELGLQPRLVEAVCQGGNVGLRNAALAVLGGLGEAVADRLVSALDDVPAGAVKFVIEALGAVGGDRAATALVAQLDSDDPNNVAAALEALATAGGPIAEAALRDRLAIDDSFQRMAALDALNRLGASIDWDVLGALVSEPSLRGVLVPALGRSGDPRAVDYLVGSLRHVAPRRRLDVSDALLQLCEADPTASELLGSQAKTLDEALCASLLDMIGDADVARHAGAVLVLCHARYTPVLPRLLSLVYEVAPGQVLHDALDAWGEPLVEQLFAVASRGDASLPAAALTLAADLAQVHAERDPSAAAALRARVRAELRGAIRSSDLELRVAAASAFAVWADSPDADTLVSAASDGGERLALACGRSLSELAARAPDDVRSALEDISLETEGGIALVELMVQLEGERVLPKLRATLMGAGAEGRCAAVAGMAALGGPQAAELIALSLTDESWDVQLAAAEALGRVVDAQGEPLGVEALLLSLDGSPPELQAAASRALGLTGAPRAIGPLRTLLDGAESAVRVAALESLCELNAPGLQALLLDALTHDDSELVKQALSRLAIDEPGAALDAALSMLEHPRWDVRQLAVQLLSDRRDERVVSALRARSEIEDDEFVRQALADAAGGI